MKISVYHSIRNLSISVDIEYNSENVSDCAQADKFVSRVFERGNARRYPA